MNRLLIVMLVAQLALASACRRHETTTDADHSPEPAPEHSTEIALDAATERLLGIEVARVERTVLPLVTRASGRIEAQFPRTREVSTPFSGRVEKVLVEINQAVRPGQELALISSPELPGLRAELAKAEAAVATAEKTHARQQRLKEIGAGSERELQQARMELEAARIERERAAQRIRESGLDPEAVRQGNPRIVISAPESGVVIARRANPGELVQSQAALFRLVNLDVVDAVLEVFESDLGAVQVGRQAEVRVPAYPGRVFRGRVTSIGATLSDQNRTAQVRVALSNPGHLLKPQMLCEGEVWREAKREVLAVPASAIVDDDGVPVVYVRQEGKYLRHPVRLGARTQAMVEVVSGVDAGEQVVTQGGYQLKTVALKARPQAEHED